MRLHRSNSLFKFVLAICCCIGIMGYLCSSDDDGYLFLLQKNTKLGQATVKIISTITTSLGIQTNTSVKGHAGLNTLLIAQMTEGYAKDYLKICKENEEGKLDVTKRDAYATLASIIAINGTETGYYSVGDNCTLPKSDIPLGKITSNAYGNGIYSLYSWGEKEHNSAGGISDFGGPFQYTPGPGQLTPVNTKSVYHDKYNLGTTGGGKGDCYNLPDIICGLNSFAQNGANECKIDDTKDLTEDEISYLTTITHNVGSGAFQFLYGIPYKKAASTYLKTNQIKGNEVKQAIDVVANDCINSVKKMNNEDLDWLYKNAYSPVNWIAADIGLTTQGWYLDEKMCEHILGYSQSVKVWNCFYPSDKVSSLIELKPKLEAKTKTMSELTGYSTAECDSIYGTVNGTHENAVGSGFVSQKKYGVILKLSGTSSKYENKKNAKQVYAIPGIPLSHAYSAIVFGKVIAAKMMKYAGVGVDPTNPDTYLEKIVVENNTVNNNSGNSGGTYIPSNSNFEKELEDHGCDMSKLNDARYKVLATAHKMQGSRYSWGGGHNASCGVNNPGYDCSGFVYHAIVDSGLPETSAQEWCSSFGRACTFGPSINALNSKIMYVKYKPGEYKLSDLKPGDILSTSSHVMLYVSTKGGKIYTQEAYGRNYGYARSINGWQDRNANNITGRFYVTRLKAYND